MLILVRHGRTDHNAGRRLLGRRDVPLDELGERQAAALGASLPAVQRVVSSPLSRCRATAAALGRPVDVDDRWAEVDYGVLDGCPLDEVPGEAWAAWAADPHWAPEGGESMAALAARVAAACDDLWAEAATGDVAVVTHVSPIKAAVAWALGLGGHDLGARMTVAVASVSRIGPGRGGGPALLSFNEVHLRPSS